MKIISTRLLRAFTQHLLTLSVLLCTTTAFATKQAANTFYQFEPITLTFKGPQVDELDEVNPFLNYRLNVTFTHQGKTYLVPGYFAADGNAAETSATSGNQWQVKFAAEFAGNWRYKVSFRQGENIAVLPEQQGKAVVDIDGLSGTLKVLPSRPGPYAKGRLQYVGEHYLRFSGNGQYLIKTGVDSPENILAYDDFDATPNVKNLRKSWQAHLRDYNSDADKFLWQGDKGKELFGVINYLYEEGLNSFSFLTFNVDGDDRNVFPHLLKGDPAVYEQYAGNKKQKQAWNLFFHRTRFDVSKLAQWDRIFTYGTEKDFFLHFKTHEEETDHIMDNTTLGIEQKLYFREIIARFAHHPSLNWNLGEENDAPRSLQKEVAAYIRTTSPYKKQHIVMHTYPPEEHFYADLVGDQSVLTGASVQGQRPDFRDVYQKIHRWYINSEKAGKPWALAIDEAGSGGWGLVTDEENPYHNDARIRVVWGNLLAGGWGVEWYFPYHSPHNDLEATDFRSRDLFWDQNAIARKFFNEHVPFWTMRPLPQTQQYDSLYVFGIPNEHYIIMVENPVRLNTVQLDEVGVKYQVRWFNTRKGGELVKGTLDTITAQSAKTVLGLPPTEIGSDWIAVVKKL